MRGRCLAAATRRSAARAPHVSAWPSGCRRLLASPTRAGACRQRSGQPPRATARLPLDRPPVALQAGVAVPAPALASAGADYPVL